MVFGKKSRPGIRFLKKSEKIDLGTIFKLFNAEILTEISHLTYRELYEVKVVTQLVKIVYMLDPFKPKQGKGKPKKGSGAVTKKGRASVGGKLRFREH